MIAHNLLPQIVACAHTSLVSAGASDRRCCATSPPSLQIQSPTATRRGTIVHGSFAMGILAGLTTCSMTVPLSSLALDSADDEELEQWYRYEGDGFALSVPPDFEDIREPEELADGPLYGNKAKPKPFAARFASPDSIFFRSEVVSVVVRQSSQLKLTFLAVKDVSDLGSLREAADIFVPAGAKVYAARTIKTLDEDTNRTYYYYEFASGNDYIALEAGASRGNVIVVGVTAPKRKWKDDSRKLRLMAASFSLL